jgi:hypothetical protein
VSPASRSQNEAQASINFERWSSRSPREYARSTALPTVCASAISITWFGKLVLSPAHVRKLAPKSVNAFGTTQALQLADQRAVVRRSARPRGGEYEVAVLWQASQQFDGARQAS